MGGDRIQPTVVFEKIVLLLELNELRLSNSFVEEQSSLPLKALKNRDLSHSLFQRCCFKTS